MPRPTLDAPPTCYKPSIRLHPGQDDDLIAYLRRAQDDGQPIAQAIIQAMRGGLTATPTAADNIDEDSLADALADLFF